MENTLVKKELSENQKPTMSEAEIRSVIPEGLSTEFLETAEVIRLNDASSSAPNISRAVELFLIAIAARDTEGLISTAIYPGESIGYCIVNTPYSVEVPIPSKLQEDYGDVVTKSADGDSLTLANDSIDIAAEGVYDFSDLDNDQRIDPRIRIVGILERGLLQGAKHGKDSEEQKQLALRKAEIYMRSLPATFFITSDGVAYVDQVIQDRRRILAELGTRIGIDVPQERVSIEDMSTVAGDVTLREILDEGDLSASELALKSECPECSLTPVLRGNSAIQHVFTLRGQASKNNGTRMSRVIAEPKCKQMKAFISPDERKYPVRVNILDVPLSQLFKLGFRPSGKIIYALEAMINDDPNKLQLIRDYSSPRGTVAGAAKQWDGLSMLSPRVRMRIESSDGERDLTGYEMSRMFDDSAFIEACKFFAEIIPLKADRHEYKLIVHEDGSCSVVVKHITAREVVQEVNFEQD